MKNFIIIIIILSLLFIGCTSTQKTIEVGEFKNGSNIDYRIAAEFFNVVRQVPEKQTEPKSEKQTEPKSEKQTEPKRPSFQNYQLPVMISSDDL